MESKFKVGEPIIGGKVGTVVKRSNALHDSGIEFDEPINHGHDLGGTHKPGHCRYAQDSEIEALPPDPYFAGGRVGDRVYDMAHGYGRIRTIKPGLDRPLFVEFDHIGSYYFTWSGSTCEEVNQTLFYSKPVFDLPSPPKRKVKNMIEGMKIKNISKHEQYWAINFDDGGGKLSRHSLATGSESSLMLDELIIDALCKHIEKLRNKLCGILPVQTRNTMNR